MPSLTKRWSTFLAITASFLFFLVFLHKSSTKSSPPVSNRFTRSTCPATPPNPPYNLTTHGFSWRDIPIKYPISDLIPLSSERPSSLPELQHKFAPPTLEADALRKTRQGAIKETFTRAWRSYEEYAWKSDELQPVSAGWRNNFGGWGATLVDNLDTLLIMDMHEDFEKAVAALIDVDFSPHDSSQSTINVFETTIRYLGGFIAAYDLSGCNDERLLDKAVQIADMIYASYDTPTRMPVTRWNPHKATGGEEQIPAAQGIIADIASSSLEFTRLSQLTGDMRYFDAISRITNILEEQQMSTRIPGLWPVGINVQIPDLTKGSTFTFGGMADSAYEYLAKTYHLLAGVGRAPQYQKLYDNAMSAGIEHLLFRPMVPDHADILVSGIAHATTSTAGLETRSEHLACFAGGMYALGGKLFANETYLNLGRKLTDGCIWLYKNSPMGIMPEMFSLSSCPSFVECPWDERQEGVYTYVRDKRYILRPEAIESIFYMWRLTGDEKYRDTAWEMFQVIEQYTKTEYGNAALRNVMEATSNPDKEDSMESFWMAETLKYLYLIFSETDLVSLDEFVFNTEAHPFRIPQ